MIHRQSDSRGGAVKCNTLSLLAGLFSVTRSTVYCALGCHARGNASPIVAG